MRGLGLLDAQLAEALGGDERVERDDAHAERAGADGDELADAAEAEHAERLALDLDAAELRALPLAGGERRVRLRDVAGEREHQRDGVLGRGDHVGLRRVGDDDAALGRGGDVDVVDADAGAADHLQVVGALDQLGVELRRRADQDPVVGADALQQLLAAPVGAEIDVEALAQHVDAGVGDLLRDEDPVGLGEQGSCGRRDAGLEEDPLRGADARAVLDLVAELGERDLQAAERRQDVERAEVAAVGDPDDLALEVVLAAVGGDAELAQRAGDLVAVDRSGSSSAVTTVERSSGSPKSSRPSAAAPARVARASRSWRAKTSSRPSCSIMSSATSRPRNSGTAGVNGQLPLRWDLAVLTQSK